MIKRILYVTTTTKSEGPGNILGGLITHLDRKQYQPIVVSIFAGGEWDQQFARLSIPHISLDLPKPRDVLAPIKLVRIIKKIKPDLIHAQLLRADIYAGLASRLTATPVMTTVQNMEVWKRYNNPVYLTARFLDRWGLNHCAAIVAVSNAVKKDLVKRQKMAPARIAVIPNSIDIKTYSGGGDLKKRKETRDSLGIPFNAKLVFTSARVTNQKAPEVWLAAVKKILKKEDHLNVFFVWAGDGPLLGKTRLAVKKEGLTRNVRLLGERHDIPNLLAATDYYMLSSRYEGLPLALIEAMTAGKPCIATNVSGNPELIINRQTGLLVPPENPKAMALALEEYLQNPDLADKLAHQAALFAKKHFNISLLAKRYMNLYKKILRG